MRFMLSTLAILAAAPAFAQAPQVVVDTPVTASLVSQVTGDGGTVSVLLPQGASVHHHQMRPSDARNLQAADLLIWTGPELTPWLERSAATLGGDAAQLRLLEVADTHRRPYGDGQAHDDHGDDHGHDHGHDHDHGHGGGAVDPHAWLDPDNARTWLAAIAEALATADPANRDAYADNARAAADRIAALDRALQARLAPHAEAGFVVFHDAYGYFTDHFGLKPAIAVSLGDATAPSAARLSAIRARIVDTGATCAFPEYGSDPRLMDTVAEGTGLRMGGELSPEGSALPPGPDLYASLMTAMAERLEACLSKG